jgi:hypothetical protein
MLSRDQLNARLVAAGQMLRLLAYVRDRTDQRMGEDTVLRHLASTHPLQAIARIRLKIGELWSRMPQSERDALDEEIGRILDPVTPEPDNPGGVATKDQGPLTVAYYRYDPAQHVRRLIYSAP